MGSHIQHRRGAAKWWTSVDGDCPISLVAIAELQKPPFALPSPGGAPPHYFDARFLASFLVSSTAFMNPVNRQPLGRSDCMALDTHVRRYHPSDPITSVTDAFDLFAKRGPHSDQAQREATAVLQHLFQFGYSQQQATRRQTSTASPLEETQTLVVSSEAFPALANSRRTARAPGHSIVRHSQLQQQQQWQEQQQARPPRPRRRAQGDRGRATRALPTPAAQPEQPIAVADVVMEADVVMSEQPTAVPVEGTTMAFATAAPPISRYPEYLRPTKCIDVSMEQVAAEADRDSRIEEEVEALMAIYGEEDLSSRRLLDERGRSCWEIEVDTFPWRLHVLIPAGLPYPFVCPMLCPRHGKCTLTAQLAQRIVDILGEVAQREAGEVFIFSLVEALKGSEVADALHL